MADKKFDLGDYVEVKDRIRVLYECFPQARVETMYELTSDPDEKPKVIVRAYVYRTPEDERPAGHGTSWMYLPGTTSYTRGSEIENAETSAVGRAIGMLGILIDRSVATSTEIEAKAGDKAKHLDKPDQERVATHADEPEFVARWSGTGAIGVNPKPPADGFLRQEEDGAVLVVTFTEPDNRKIPQVVLRGALAVDFLDSTGGNVKGFLCTLEGDLYRVPWFKEGRPMTPYQRLEVTRISTPGWSLPAPAVAAVPEPDSGPSSDVRAGAPPDEEAELDALVLPLGQS